VSKYALAKKPFKSGFVMDSKGQVFRYADTLKLNKSKNISTSTSNTITNGNITGGDAIDNSVKSFKVNININGL